MDEARRDQMSPIKLAVTAIGVVVTVSRHPLVRAGIKAAPHRVTPRLRAAATETALNAAYNVGVVARRIIPRNLM